MLIRWSVGIEAQGDRIMKLEEVVELADAVAPLSGIATGIGTNRYGAQVIVFADNREDAIAKGKDHFASAVQKAGLPVYPIVRVEATSEDEDDADDL
ncbi:MAG: hypothetical protein WAN20_07125 [Pseudonocardiaceae bacterium]|jgi:hypothetical protein|nr:hypothetical protein [Pseudonocardiaceae bacterium]